MKRLKSGGAYIMKTISSGYSYAALISQVCLFS